MTPSNYTDSTALRHTPKQTRGQRTVEHILRNAETLFAEVGFENATTNAIAERAGVSIGSLYQFFSSKDAILEAMADRYLEQTRTVLGKALDSTEPFELDSLLGRLLETTVKLQEQRPYFLQCLRQYSPTPAVTKAVNELNSEFSGRAEKLLERSSVETDPKVLKLRAQVMVETMGALLPLALHARGRERTRAINEIKLVLIRYIEPTLKVKGML